MYIIPRALAQNSKDEGMFGRLTVIWIAVPPHICVIISA